MHSGNKRRRIDQAASSLGKPFRSPLRADANSTSSTTKSQAPSSNTTASSKQACTDLSDHVAAVSPASSPPRKINPVLIAPSSQSSPAKPLGPPRGLDASSRTSTRSTLFASIGADAAKSSEYIAGQKQHTRLLGELAELKKSLDLTQQALKIESSNQDEELEALITKWCGIARDAAEEMFSVSKDKVNRMGGLTVWKERAQKRQQAWDIDDQHQGFGFANGAEIDEDALTLEQKDDLAQMRDEAEQERLKYGDLANDMGQERLQAL